MTHRAPGSDRARTARHARVRRRVVGVLAGAAALTALLAAMAGWGANAQPRAGGGRAGAALTGDRAVAERTSFDVVTTSSGELEARERIEIRSPLDQEATIVQIAAEGIWAKKGDLLMQLNTDSLQQKIDDESLRLRTEAAELGSAQTAFNIQEKDNEANIRQGQLKVDLAQLALQQWREGDVKKKRQDLTLAIDRASLELDRLAERFLRSRELLEEGFVSKDECDRDEVSYIEAISAYNTAVLARDVYEQYELVMEEKSKVSDVDEALANLERIRLTALNELENKRQRLEAQKERATIVERRLRKLEENRAAATILAPSDGLVVYATSMERNSWRGGSEGPLQIGQQVYPNQLLMILPNTTEMMAAVRVSESLAGRVRPGQTATVRIDAAGARTFAATVEGIGVMAETGGWRDPNLREYTVRLAIHSAGNSDLKPAMRCEANITLDTVTDALAVPVQGVFSDGPVHFVYTPEGSRFKRTPIKLGRRSDTRAEIISGLNPGDVVLIREPTPGEILTRDWDTQVLTTLGYKIGADGRPVAGGPPPGMVPPGAGQRPDRARREGAGREGRAGDGARPAPQKPAAEKPAAEKPVAEKPTTEPPAAETPAATPPTPTPTTQRQ
ncbi:MAG: HlyD family efflux transporter periplasmic adaptor subunit [Planctomycetota bacterium]|nr:HlyD family efflux transporter periplasmic adaptor subunit [Planctomycetota bacterium]